MIKEVFQDSHKNLFNRFLLVFTFLIIFIILAISGLTLFHQRNVYEKEIKERWLDIARFSAISFANAIYTHDYDFLQEFTKSLTKEKDILYSAVVSKDLVCYAHSKPKFVSEKFKDPLVIRCIVKKNPILEMSFDNNKYVCKVATPITVGKKFWGVGRIQYSAKALTIMKNRLYKGLLLFTVIFFLLGIIVAFILVKDIVTPIANLAKLTQIISQGNLDVKCDLERQDEIGILANSFNLMVVNLKNMRTHLENTNSLLSNTLEATADGILVVNNKKEIVKYNQKFEEMFIGIFLKNRESKTVEDCISEEYSGLKEKLQNMPSEASSNFEILNFRKKQFFECYSQPQEFSGEIVGRVWSFRDISERIEAEKQAKIQQQQLVQVDKMIALGTLVSGVAHEINNPNNFITLNISVLEQTWQSIEPILDLHCKEKGDIDLGGMLYSEMRKDIPKLFDGIKDGANRIKNIVQDLKNFSRPDNNVSQQVNLNEVVKDNISLLDNIIRKNTDNFIVKYADQLPCVMGSKQQLGQVLINLIQNACDALSQRDQKLLVQTYYNEPKKRVILQVIDEGVGIKQEILPQITDPFFTTKRDSKGIGLGLSISLSIVKNHKGSLFYKSRENKGTTATVSIPVSLHAKGFKIE